MRYWGGTKLGAGGLTRAYGQAISEAIKHAESASDYVSRQLFSDILDSEEEHIDWLETQLSVIDRIGEQNYLLTKLEDE